MLEQVVSCAAAPPGLVDARARAASERLSDSAASPQQTFPVEVLRPWGADSGPLIQSRASSRFSYQESVTESGLKGLEPGAQSLAGERCTRPGAPGFALLLERNWRC